MGAQCDKVLMVVGRQFITLSIHLCVHSALHRSV